MQDKENIIISDFDRTISKKTIIYIYLIYLLYLCPKNNRLIKYIKLFFIPFVSIIFGIIYLLFGEYICLQFVNYYVFSGININDCNQTIKSISHIINNNLNEKVLESIDKYESQHKYIITGNYKNIIKYALLKYKFNVYGSTLKINKKTNTYTGFTDFVCLGENKLIALNQILTKLGKQRCQLNLIAYGDSYNDFFILKAANIRYVVGSDQKLLNALDAKELCYEQIL